MKKKKKKNVDILLSHHFSLQKDPQHSFNVVLDIFPGILHDITIYLSNHLNKQTSFPQKNNIFVYFCIVFHKIKLWNDGCPKTPKISYNLLFSSLE